ncbi:MAG: hypothetical protein PVF96_08220 [Candidatus Bathyarchaeota archaeon]
MKRFLLISFVLFTLLISIFIHWRGISVVKSSPDIHQGDLVLQGNNVTVIEGSFDINGSIIIEENATLVLRNAILNITHPGGIFLQNPVNGNPRLQATDTVIVRTFYNRIYDNSSVTFSNCSSVGFYYFNDEVNSTILDSTINFLQIRGSPKVIIANSTIERMGIVSFSSNVSISNLSPGFFDFWDFRINCSVHVYPSGQAPNVSLTQVTINNWEFSFQSSTGSYQEIINSEISNLHSNGVTHTSACNSSFGKIELYSVSEVKLTNSTCTTYRPRANSTIYMNWYLNVQVIDSIDQNVPSANVTATYINATIAEQKLTATNGKTRLTLMQKMLNVTGEYIIGNYTIEATYDIYSTSTSVNMTENKQITLKLEDFVIPEFPSLHVLTIFMIIILLTVTFYRRRIRFY